jgi:hypothetical protein
MSLRLDWCSHEAAKYAVEKWHYSRRMPLGRMSRVGVWENEKYIGCVLFARGANNAIGDAYGLKIIEICELVRVALTIHVTPVSRIGAIAIKMLVKQSPGLRLIVSYADDREGHHGGIYQAMNWVYIGKGASTKEWYHEGRWKHNREMTSGAFGGGRKVAEYQQHPMRIVPGKHKYLYPLDAAMRAQIAPLAKPYPKRATRAASIDSDAPGIHPGEGGADPTAALQTNNDH